MRARLDKQDTKRNLPQTQQKTNLGQEWSGFATLVEVFLLWLLDSELILTVGLASSFPFGPMVCHPETGCVCE